MTEETIARIEEDVKIIKDAVVGKIENGVEKPGLIGQIALVKQSLGRAWWAISLIIATILGSAAWIIRSGLK